jgi:hypothetical protein
MTSKVKVNTIAPTTGTTLTFEVSNSERMRIASNGDVYVGATDRGVNYVAGLHLSGSGGNKRGIEISRTNNPSNGTQTAVFQTYGNSSANMGCMKHTAISNPAGYLFFSDGDSSNYYLYQNAGVWRTSIVTNNIGTTSGTIIGSQTSDERVKDIEPSFEYGLDTVMALKPIAYTRNDQDAPVRQLGFGAQTTQSIVPESVYDTGECLDGYDVDSKDSMVQTSKSNDTKLAMEYVQIVPVLVKAMQEQQAMIETLQAEVAALLG